MITAVTISEQIAVIMIMLINNYYHREADNKVVKHENIVILKQPVVYFDELVMNNTFILTQACISY